MTTLKDYEGKTLTVKDWFAAKKQEELGLGRRWWFRIFAILKETEKAVYAIVDFGSTFRTFWIPKRVIVEDPDMFDCKQEDSITSVAVNIDLSEDAYDRWVKELKWEYSVYA